MKMKKLPTAKQFYQRIEKEENKYRLVNDGFIIKYLDDEISYYVGEFLRAGSPRNNRKTNLVNISPRFNLRYHKKKNMATTTLGFWRPLDLKNNL